METARKELKEVMGKPAADYKKIARKAKQRVEVQDEDIVIKAFSCWWTGFRSLSW